MSKKRGRSLKDNELTKDWVVEDILDVEGDKITDSGVKRYSLPRPSEKIFVRFLAVGVAVVLTVVGCFAFAGRGGGMSSVTVQAKEETRVVTSEYLSSMNNGKTGVLHIDEKKIGDISEKVSDIITDDMVKSAEDGETEALLNEIETGVANILKEDPEFTANLSDEDMENIINSVTAIVKSELNDSVESATSSIKITASTTKNVDRVQQNVNDNTEQMVGLSNSLTDTKSEIEMLSKKIESFVSNQDSVNRDFDGRINEANSKSGSNSTTSTSSTVNATDEQLRSEVKTLEERLEQLESDYENLSSQYSSSKQSIVALQLAASGYADTTDVVAVSDSLSDMNETMQLQLSEIMNQISILEANAGDADKKMGTFASNDDYETLKGKVSGLQKQLKDASDTVAQLMNMPEGTDLSTALGEYMAGVQQTNSDLKGQFDNFKRRVETNERRYDSMYSDYNKLLLDYKNATGSILSLSEILATKGDKKDLDALKGYAYELYKVVITNHRTVMEEIYGDEWQDDQRVPTVEEVSARTENNEAAADGTSVNDNTGSEGTVNGADGQNGADNGTDGQNGANGNADTSGNNGAAGSGSADNGKSNAYSDQKAIRSEISDLHDEADQLASDIEKMYQQIWGLEPGATAEKMDNSQLLRDLDAQINSASQTLADLQSQSANSQGGDNGQNAQANVQINSSSSSLQQAISNVISAYQTADNAIIDALKNETANRQKADEGIQDQIDALSQVVTDNNTASTSDTLAIKKAIATYVKDVDQHPEIPAKSYIYYDGNRLDGKGFYFIENGAAANQDLEGRATRTTVAKAIENCNGKIGELVKLLQQNEEFAQRYKLK